MPIKRVLERGGKQLVFRAEDRTSAVALVKETRAKIKQGWVPTTPAKSVLAFAKALDKLNLWEVEACMAFTDDEIEVVYADLIKRKQPGSPYVLIKRPSRALFAYMIKGQGGYELKSAVKQLAKDPEQKAWIIEEFQAALANKKGFANEASRSFAERWLKLLGAPAPVAPKHDAGTHEAKLLAAILEAPEDNGPREIYADWLIDQGNPFGEYIHAALAGNTELADKLEKKHAKAWLAPIKPFARSTRFERGLVGYVHTEGAGFVKAAAAIAARSPRADLTLEGVKKSQIAAIAAAPLGTFERVVLSQQRLDDADISLIVNSPTLAGVEDLDLSECKFGDAGLLAIAASPNLAAVHTLDLSQRYGRDPKHGSREGVTAVLASKRLPKLRDLRMFGASFSGAFTTSVLKLQALSLDAAAFTNEDMAELASSKAFANLERLTIGCRFGTLEVDKKAVAAARKKLPKLTYVYVQGVVEPD